MKFTCLLKLKFFLPAFWSLRPVVIYSRQRNVTDTYSFAGYLPPSLLALFFSLSVCSTAFSQGAVKDTGQDAAYTRTINQRADKIVATLNITDAAKATRVRDIIANQYRSLNDIHTKRDQQVKAIKAKGNNSNTESINAEVDGVQEKAKVKIDKLHAKYLESLSKEITAEQIDQVKDGMTYGVVPITYKGYQAMIPTLTEGQKKQILNWLIEARELAMDAETSDKKHGWFGKYKGRINNYLSAQGYDVNKASKEWQERIKAEEAAKKGH